MTPMQRRDFLVGTAITASGIAVSARSIGPMFTAPVLSGRPSRVAFVKTTDRGWGVKRAIEMLELPDFGRRDLFVKPNFNSADDPPGSTHNDTLVALLGQLRKMGAGPLTIGDRSGMGDTRKIMQAKGIFRMGDELGVRPIVFDELSVHEWELIQPGDTHWQRGFLLPKLVLESGGVITTCCLKTHRYGGHFTLSLKNSVGLAAKYMPGDTYNYMRELHGSPDQRKMIAEVNAVYRPVLVLVDGVEAFTTGGPDIGTRVHSNLILAGTDRIAIDAVGVAVLRHYGTTPEVARGEIFDQEQIARAAELGIGARSANDIELITGDRQSAEYAKAIRAILDGGHESAPESSLLPRL